MLLEYPPLGKPWSNKLEFLLKYRVARMQPLTRGPEADETKTMTVTLPHRV